VFCCFDNYIRFTYNRGARYLGVTRCEGKCTSNDRNSVNVLPRAASAAAHHVISFSRLNACSTSSDPPEAGGSDLVRI